MKKDDSYRVFRGGGWYGDVRMGRVANRRGNIPSYRYVNLGFRLSRTVNPLEQLSEEIDEKG